VCHCSQCILCDINDAGLYHQAKFLLQDIEGLQEIEGVRFRYALSAGTYCCQHWLNHRVQYLKNLLASICLVCVWNNCQSYILIQYSPPYLCPVLQLVVNLKKGQLDSFSISVN
jgi:hypothetical protein